ncbi:MAG: hypothetical protein ACREP3_00360 [Candidatus Binatia bacterium]
MKIGIFLVVSPLPQCVLRSAAGAQSPQKIRIGYPSMEIQNLIDMSAPQIPQAKSAKPEQYK